MKHGCAHIDTVLEKTRDGTNANIFVIYCQRAVVGPHHEDVHNVPGAEALSTVSELYRVDESPVLETA